jgi:hypothetical protein
MSKRIGRAVQFLLDRVDTEALRMALVPWTVGKLVTAAVVTMVVFAQSNHLGHPTWDQLLAPFAYWDGQNYTAIADHGYPSGPLDLIPGHPGHLWGFFPGFAILVSLGVHLGLGSTLAGIIVNAVAELVALYYLVRLVSQERDSEAARFAAWLLALWPDAIVLSMVNADSSFIAAATASLYYMRRGDNSRACIAGALAVGFRVIGLALIPALLIEYLRHRQWRPGPGLLPIAGTLLPLAGFLIYSHAQTGDWLAYSHAQSSPSYGNRTLTWPWIALLNTWHYAFGSQPSSFALLEILDLIFGLAALAAVVYMWSSRRIAASLAAYTTCAWLLPASLTYWAGMPRYAMQLMPAAIVLADLTRRSAARRATVIAVSAALMGYGATVIALGRYLE